MCLSSAKPWENPPKSFIGYKVFWERPLNRVDESGKPLIRLMPDCESTYRGRYVKGYTIGVEQRSRRGPGYHFFLTLEGAQDWCDRAVPEAVYRCRFRKLREIGEQHGYDAATAERMIILERVE